MGGYHGAEVCDLIGLYLLSQLSEVVPASDIGLYRDDGLCASTATPRQLDIIRKKICKIFQQNDLKVTTEANSKVVHFLDVTFDLNTGLYSPYMKENDQPLYVDINSNHPPLVLKNIPLGINRRLSKISANKEIFDKAKKPYQDALQRSGYSHILEYTPPTELPTKKKNRKLPVTWFNPPFSVNVSTNIGRMFLTLLDRSFTPDNPLSKLFNRHTVKISYKRMPNMAQAVAGHNSKILRDDSQNNQQPGCNCMGGPATCPVQGQCQATGVVYEATVTELGSGSKETYTGVTARPFKDRLYEHRTDANSQKGRAKTALSTHIWALKDRNVGFDISWRLKYRGPDYNPLTKKCRICLMEKFYIMHDRGGSTLNKRSEVFHSCTHKRGKLLENVKI